MKFVTYQDHEAERAGILSEDLKSVHSFEDVGIHYEKGTMLDFITHHTEGDLNTLRALSKTTGAPLSSVTLLAPIPRPSHNILCLGLNYMDHVLETSENGIAKSRTDAVYFSKYVTRAVGPEGSIKSHRALTSSLDYEAELAVVLGRDACCVKKEDALRHIFGLMCFNDVSARDIQKKHQQWLFGKSLDTFSAFGPYIVSMDEFSFPLKLGIQCRLNGELRQSSNTKNMLFSIDHVLQELSCGMTLEAGTIIATGTPSGVGMATGRYMKAGDIVEVEVEGCGILRNHIVD